MRRAATWGVLLVALPNFVFAQSACFCLQHPETLQIVRYGCESFPRPNRPTPRITCQTQDLSDRAAFDDHASFTIIPDGEGLCEPCYATAPSNEESKVRGDGRKDTDVQNEEGGDE